MKTLLTLLLLICLFYGCTEYKTSSKQNDIFKIIFASGYCHGECPFQAIEIDSSLTYKYYGGQHAKNKGYFRGTIDEGFWESLKNDLKKIEYWNLDTIYDDTYDDQSMEVIIYKGKYKKHIRGQEKSLPKGLQNLLYKLYYSVDLADIKAIRDTIQFESTVQNPLKFTGPKFPPANLKPSTPK